MLQLCRIIKKISNLKSRRRELGAIVMIISDIRSVFAATVFKIKMYLIVVYLISSCVNWAYFLTSGPLLNASETNVLKAHECQKRPNLHTNELNTTFFCSTSPFKVPNCLKSLKLT
jgi:hypothetical protein